MKKVSLVVSISMLFLNCGASEVARIRAKHLIASHELGKVTLRRDEESFFVKQGALTHKVAQYDVDPLLRKLDKSNIFKYLKDNKIMVVKMSDGSFALRSHLQGMGGGFGGGAFGFYAAKFSVLFLGHGAIQVAALLTGPAYPVTLAALEGTFLVPIEAASMTAGLAGSILGAAVTGPV